MTETCLFFTDDKIITNNMNPLLDYEIAVAALNLNIINTIVDDTLTIIKCEVGNENLEFQILNVKRFLSDIESPLRAQILRAYHWLNWDSQSKYCGHCGAVLESQPDSTEKKCSACGTSFFPRFSPAVMVLVQKGDKILLARSHHFPPGYYSAIAGFIDIGETAEQAAHREVKEELGIEITDLEYFGTQTWPFPDSFMIAFRAKYLSGELILEENEIEAADWFSANNLPTLPMRASIARQLIESAINQ